MRILHVVWVLLVAALRPAAAQPQPDSTLRADVLAADSALFMHFNAHDLRGTMSWFARDVEFFHDAGGLQHYADIEAGFRGNFVKANGLRRERLPEVAVYAIPRYGAMEIGA